MSNIHYEQAANDLRTFLEDSRIEELDGWNLEKVLRKALTNRYVSRNIPLDIAEEAARDDALMITLNVDTLRPILEAYWEAR